MNGHIKKRLDWVKTCLLKLFQKNEKAYFSRIKFLEITPKDDAIGSRDFILVVYKGKSYWVMFRCPCGCCKVICLPLRSSEGGNRWQLEVNNLGKPTLYPSIRQNTGCKSHFWVKNGKIQWCTDDEF